MAITKKALTNGQQVKVARPGTWIVADLHPRQHKCRGLVLVRCIEGELAGMAYFERLDGISL